MKSKLHIPFNAPLHKKDSEAQTFGCRANNPDICKNHMLPSVCAFCKADSICLKPSQSWRKQYLSLKEEV